MLLRGAYRRCPRHVGHRTRDGTRCVPRQRASLAAAAHQTTRSSVAGWSGLDHASSAESWPTTSLSSPCTRRGGTTPASSFSSNARKPPMWVSRTEPAFFAVRWSQNNFNEVAVDSFSHSIVNTFRLVRRITLLKRAFTSTCRFCFILSDA